MRVLVCLEHRFSRTPDGAVWTQIAFDYSFWQRYLEVFDQVCVVARVRDVSERPADHVRADGDQISVSAVPFYLGPLQYVQRRREVRLAVEKALQPGDAVILRVGSQVANCLFPKLRESGRPFAVEVVGDPWDVFSPGAVKHPLRIFFRWHFWRRLREQCAHACAAAYVTERTLQSRYPAIAATSTETGSGDRQSRSYAISDVRLPAEAFARGPFERKSLSCLRLVFVGSLAQLYKGPDVLLDAVAQCVSAGVKIHLTMIGDGKYRSELEERAGKLGIANDVVFLGQIAAGPPIREELDKADVFVMPSRTEGLPRALLEAMARSLSCVASKVGGIPELLSSSDLVPPGSVDALAAKIVEVSKSETHRMEMARRNYERALCFRDEILNDRRRTFFEVIRQQTNEWMAARRVA
jgi:hypothetical protein